MKRIKLIVLALVAALATAALAQSPEPPLADTRISVNTLLREDIFAGFISDDMERFARGEKNIQLLIEKRPADKALLLAWQGGATLYRAVRAHENNRADEFQQYYRQATDLFSQARQLGPTNGGVIAITGGSQLLFADRLPKAYRAAAWSEAYAAYQALWKEQAPVVDKLPVHLRGELLGGLTQAAQRTGHTAEVEPLLDKMLTALAGTPYEPMAKQWKKNPESAANTSLTCLTCHEGGRLAARVTALNK